MILSDYIKEYKKQKATSKPREAVRTAVQTKMALIQWPQGIIALFYFNYTKIFELKLSKV